MLIQNPREFYREVYQQPFAMPAFNVCNLEMAKAVIEAAVAERAPVIVQTYPGDLAHAAFGDDMGPLPLLIRAMAQAAPIPVFLHLDHGPGLAYNLRCLRAGYNSVMFDGHDLPLDEALLETAAIARAAHALDAAVEGELGTFGGAQGSQEYTNPEETPLMFEQGQVDMLAVSVGSEHGQSSRLDLELLTAINDKVHAPLVLHGGSGIHEDDVRAAIRLGVVKINIGAALSRAWCQGSREALEAGADHYGVLDRAMQRVHEVARHRLQLMGASGRA
ncbi:class II fructose-bisphosphate aldolase [Caldilinea sp.]|uniref:class II fructose-bisphosphate aldolase n=1 Tax=Caldilinea sp. TaxID=2293560 RepID=UPI002C3C595E|nr:class II fructose-bisphosphate aldolase [Caldilinea sp.]HRA64425.1 class II fructose-bisphosphate aldolase [Caldilinea sp.]